MPISVELALNLNLSKKLRSRPVRPQTTMFLLRLDEAHGAQSFQAGVDETAVKFALLQFLENERGGATGICANKIERFRHRLGKGDVTRTVALVAASENLIHPGE